MKAPSSFYRLLIYHDDDHKKKVEGSRGVSPSNLSLFSPALPFTLLLKKLRSKLNAFFVFLGHF